MTTTTTLKEIRDIVSELQNSSTEAYGSGPGHAFSSGYLGSVLAGLLERFAPAHDRDIILQDMIRMTKRNREAVPNK